MKRDLLHFSLLLAIAFSMMSLSSCRSAKKADSSYYDTQIENVKRGRHKKDKAGIEGSKTGKKIVKEAEGWLGTPYGYGRAEKGVACDCSGMVVTVYEKVTGIKLPRNSAQQKEFCKELKKKDVRVGDLCFFATGKDEDKVSHVGIMVDENNFIHASASKGVVVSDITQPYYVRTFKGYGRVPEKVNSE